MNRAIRFKFGKRIEDAPFLRVDHKATPKWAWPWSRDPISKCMVPLIIFERSINQYPFINEKMSKRPLGQKMGEINVKL